MERLLNGSARQAVQHSRFRNLASRTRPYRSLPQSCRSLQRIGRAARRCAQQAATQKGIPVTNCPDTFIEIAEAGQKADPRT
jgi:hypothetical protein